MTSTAINDGRHYSGTYTRLVVTRVRDVLGDDGVTELLARCGQEDRLAALSDDAAWSSYTQFRRLLESAADLLGGTEELHGIATTAVLEAGSTPGMTEALVAMGSPGALIADLNDNNAGTTTVEDSSTSQVGPTTWDLGWRSTKGTEPFEALCVFHLTTATLLPRLFGCSGVEVEEITCQRRGDHWCTLRLSWDEDGGDAQRADFLATKLTLVERRLEVFQETVADVVGTKDLDAALRGIVAAAAAAVRVPGFVLALDPLPWSAKLVYGLGFSQEEADAIASTGGTDADLVVEVESGRAHHGRLIAVGATGLLSVPMHGLLRGYAQLAATALDGAIAVEEAHRQASTARMLLDLAMRLARTGSLKELAQTLADVVFSLIDCDRSAVCVVDGLVATPIAAHGYSPEIHDLFVGVPIALPGPPSAEVVYTDRSRAFGNVLETMEMTGCVNSVMVPIVVDGAVLAWISADVTHDASRLRPSRELEERLHGLAAQASTAMHNTLLLERVSHQAEHDSLTGLPNRKVLVDRLVDAPEPATAVLFVDLDDFKDVNDGLGHHAGDILLCQVAERLRAAVRDRDMVARLGGDEFAVLVFDPKPGAGQHVAQRVIQAFDEPFDLLGQRVNISASVGIAEGGVTPDELLRSADVAMYRAKAAGKGRMALFEPGMDHAAGERLSLHADLANAITAGQLRLLYQPVLDLADGSLRGGEALVRWQHPELGLLTPDRFIGLAEDTGLIGMLGKWVLDEACEQALSWPDDVAIAVNVSPRQLDDPGIVLEVAAALERTGILPRRLILEITETVLAHDADTVVPRLHELRALGVRIAVDDFGTGYSSLGALVHLPVDILKIDRAFITGMLQQPAAADLVQVLIDMGQTLGLEVVAEGIEELEQALALRDRHCRLGQGYLYSRPVPAEAFAAFLTSPAPVV